MIKRNHAMSVSPACSVEAATSNAQLAAGSPSSLSQGEYVVYECIDGYEPQSGNTERGCREDGSLTGAPLECRRECTYSYLV